MKKLAVIIVVILLVALTGFILFQFKTGKVAPSSKTQKGLSLTPKSFSAEDFQDFWVKAKEAGTIVSWAGDWKELQDDSAGPFVTTNLAKKNGLMSVIIVSSEVAQKDDFVSAVKSFAEKEKPDYFGLGNEINYVYKDSPGNIDAFAEVFSSAYDAIKSVSPKTRVFTIFQYEKPDNAVTFFDKFPKADLIALTSYPELKGYINPIELPDDYYKKIPTKKPIAFTEIGWRGSELNVQQTFITRFFSLTKSLKPEFVIWPFLYDQGTEKFLNNLGLFSSDGVETKSWKTWLSI